MEMLRGGEPKQPSRRVFLQGLRALGVWSGDRGAGCRAPVSQREREVWDHILPPAAGHTPGTRRRRLQPKGNVQRELLILQPDLPSKGPVAEKMEDVVAARPFTPRLRGTLLLLHLIFPPRRCERPSFLLMTRSCKRCSVIELQQGCCGCKLLWVFPTVSIGLFKDVNSSSSPTLAVRYINERAPSSPPEQDVAGAVWSGA